MRKKITDRIRKGSGEFIGFSISIVFLLYLFLLVFSFTIYEISSQRIQNVSREVARDAIVCESFEEAKNVVDLEAKTYLNQNKNIKRVRTKVNYSEDVEEKLVKGGLIDVEISATIKTYEPLTTRRVHSVTTIMIERTEEDD